MHQLTKERLAVFIVGGYFAVSALARPVWTIDWINGLRTQQSHWFWIRPNSEHYESVYVDWMTTMIPVVAAILAVAFLCWFVGLGRRGEADPAGDGSDGAPRGR